MNKNWAGIIRKVAVIVFTIIAGIGIYSFNAHKLVGNPMPMPFGIGAAVVLSGSMEPELSVNDLVLVREQETYETGDVVVFQEGAHLIIHRIIGIEGNTIQTQGDANNVADQPIDLSCVKGRMILHIPMIGSLVQMIQTPIGIIAVLGAAIFLMEGSFRKDRKKGDEELEELKDEIRKLRKELEDK